METDRFAFLSTRDGHSKALEFERENVVKTYRKCLLDAKRKDWRLLKRRELIRAYCEAKKILEKEKR